MVVKISLVDTFPDVSDPLIVLNFQMGFLTKYVFFPVEVFTNQYFKSEDPYFQNVNNVIP